MLDLGAGHVYFVHRAGHRNGGIHGDCAGRIGGRPEYICESVYQAIEKGRVMYTWEIDDLVRARGNILSVQEYIQVFRSPQVDHVKRDGERVQIWTKDGGFWEIEIKKQDPEGEQSSSF